MRLAVADAPEEPARTTEDAMSPRRSEQASGPQAAGDGGQNLPTAASPGWPMDQGSSCWGTEPPLHTYVSRERWNPTEHARSGI